MKNIVSLLLMSLVSITSFSADTFTAEIFVTNFNEIPISDMEVFLYETKSNKLIIQKKTNGEGLIDLTLSPGKYTLQLKENGEIKKDTELNIPELKGREVYNSVRIQVLYEERTSFEIENLNFETNSAQIDANSYQVLDRLFTYLMSESSTIYEIAGHTDSDGSETSNEVLSQKRAEAVKAYLVAKGIPETRLTAKGYGEVKPIAENTTKEGKAKNRRTEVVALP